MECRLRCVQCGGEFTASRRNAMYCSNKCKQRAKNERNRAHRVWVAPPAPPKPAPRDLESAVMDAHRVANDLGRLAASGPYQLRAACARMSAAIQLALEAEGL